MSINLERAISGAINSIVAKQQILIYQFKDTINVKGVVTNEYYPPITTLASVQLTDNQILQHINNLNLTDVYKDFRIQSYTLTGLNRNIGTGGDYIVMNGFKYKIVRVNENFNTGWIWVTGIESKNE